MLSNDNLFVISSFFKSLNINNLLLINRSPDLLKVKEKAFIPHLIIEFSKIVFDILPIALADHISIAFIISFIYSLRPSVEAAFKPSNYNASSESNLILNNAVNLISDIDVSLNEEEDLFNAVKFVYYYLSRFKFDGFHVL